MKISLLAFAVYSIMSIGAEAAVAYSFLSQDATFDGLTTTTVPLTDGSTSFSMFVNSSGGNLNSNATGLGVGDANLDGTGESISISFSIDIEFNLIDLGAVGADSSDGASFTINAATTDLFTGVTGFNGSTDVYTPSSPIALTAGNTIVLTGSSDTSTFDLDGIDVTAVPESSVALLGGLGLLALLRRRR